MAGVFAVLFALASIAAAQQKVAVSFYGEAFCPYCQQFMGGALNKTLEAEGVFEILDFHYYPWGNAYYNISACGRPIYDKEYSMYCWVRRCGVASPPADCFTGTILCQHGSGECVGNTIEACANLLIDPIDAARFNYCFEIQHGAAASAVQPCARAVGVDANAITACSSGTRGQQASALNARATASLGPNRQGVPWVLLNGQPLQDTENLLTEVCKAYTGSKPAGCR